ncbi:MAG: hypothetical protein ABIH86_06155 [Planctomycetota bacterium]
MTEPAKKKRTSLLFLLLLTALLTVWHSRVYVSAIKENGELRARIHEGETERAVLRANLERQKDRIRRIRENDPYLLDIYVRSELGWLGPNEVFSTPLASANGQTTR